MYLVKLLIGIIQIFWDSKPCGSQIHLFSSDHALSLCPSQCSLMRQWSQYFFVFDGVFIGHYLSLFQFILVSFMKFFPLISSQGNWLTTIIMPSLEIYFFYFADFFLSELEWWDGCSSTSLSSWKAFRLAMGTSQSSFINSLLQYLQ